EAGLHQAERHAAGGGRRRGGAVRGDASPAGGCDGNTADADGLYGEGLKRMRKSERGTRNIRGEFEERRPDRHSPGCSAFRVPRSALLATLLLVCASSLSSAQSLPALPDTTGFGVHVLAIARAPDKTIWVGSYGQGIFVLRPGASSWEQLRHATDSAVHSISWDFVHAFGFGPAGEIWYGTAWRAREPAVVPGAKSRLQLGCAPSRPIPVTSCGWGPSGACTDSDTTPLRSAERGRQRTWPGSTREGAQLARWRRL